MKTVIVDFEALKIQQEFYQIEEDARVDALRKARDEERAECAELVRAIPCACFTLCIDHDWDGKFSGKLKLAANAVMTDERKVARHDSRCSQALAAAIDARK